MRHPVLLLLLPALLLPLSGCDRRKDEVHRGVEWAAQQFRLVNAKRGLGAVSLGATLESGGDPVTWLNAGQSANSTLPCCDREPKPWRVAVTWTPEGLMTVSGYGDDLNKPLAEEKVQLVFSLTPNK
jgi:hypothetical protein